MVIKTNSFEINVICTEGLAQTSVTPIQRGIEQILVNEAKLFRELDHVDKSVT